MRPYVPLGILYLSAFLEQHGFENEVYDSTFSTLDELKQELISKKPDVVAIYTNLMTKLNVLKIISFIKSTKVLNGTRIILGGPEVTNHVENFLKHGADFLIIGEGEQTILELIKALNEKDMDYSKISGLAFISNNCFIQNLERTLIKDINVLPFPNRRKIDFTKYLSVWKKHNGYSMMSVSTMRGCPYTCKWCSRAVYGGTYRRRSPKLVAEELKFLKEKYNPDMIWFVDDVFTIHHKWLNEFAEEVVKNDALIPYEIISRADRLNEDVIKVLKASGCKRVWVGAESGSQTIIDAMDRRVDVVKTREMIKLAKSYGVEAGTFIMLGYPGESKKEIQETIDHLVASNPSHYTITIAYPITGTQLHHDVKDKLLDNGLTWENSNDRNTDFERLHPKRYYEHAIKWVMTEVYLKTRNKNILKFPYLKLKSIKYQLQMELSK